MIDLQNRDREKKIMMFNKLGHYLFKRINKDQLELKKTRPQNMVGLYINSKDIQQYINDYYNYGIDYMGDDNMSSEDFVESQINESGKELYWDEPEGEES